MEAKFGPGSDFEKKMKEFGKEMETKFGPGSEFEKKIKMTSESSASRTSRSCKIRADKARQAGSSKSPRRQGPQREQRIAALEDQIRKLAEELKALKADDDQD